MTRKVRKEKQVKESKEKKAGRKKIYHKAHTELNICNVNVHFLKCG